MDRPAERRKWEGEEIKFVACFQKQEKRRGNVTFRDVTHHTHTHTHTHYAHTHPHPPTHTTHKHTHTHTHTHTHPHTPTHTHTTHPHTHTHTHTTHLHTHTHIILLQNNINNVTTPLKPIVLKCDSLLSLCDSSWTNTFCWHFSCTYSTSKLQLLTEINCWNITWRRGAYAEPFSSSGKQWTLNIMSLCLCSFLSYPASNSRPFCFLLYFHLWLPRLWLFFCTLHKNLGENVLLTQNTRFGFLYKFCPEHSSLCETFSWILS